MKYERLRPSQENPPNGYTSTSSEFSKYFSVHHIYTYTMSKIMYFCDFVTPGDQKAHESAIESFELATFSKQAHNEECSQKIW